MTKLLEESRYTKPPGPAELSIYAPIVSDANKTGIYFPTAYQPISRLNMIVYLHGLLDRCNGAASDTVQKYWNNDYFRLRDWMNASGKDAILVVPRLGAADKTGSKLGMDADTFLK